MVETKNFKKNIIWTGKNHKKLLLQTSRFSVTVKKAQPCGGHGGQRGQACQGGFVGQIGQVLMIKAGQEGQVRSGKPEM